MITSTQNPDRRLPTTIGDTRRHPSEALGRGAWRYIRRKARQMVGKAGFTHADRADIEQELAIRLWLGMGKFQPSRGHTHGFIATIVHRAAVSLLRTRSSRRRGTHVVHHSLSVYAEQSPDAEVPALTSEVASHEQAVDLALDVATVLGQLPPELRELAEQLKRHSVQEIAERRKISRSTVYARIHKLRATFIAAGLDEFEKSRRTLRARFAKVNGRGTNERITT